MRISIIKSLVFTNRTFWEQFVLDLKRAKCRVLIHSPFVSKRRLEFLHYKFLSLIDRNVTVCVFVQKPRKVMQTGRIPDEFTYVVESLQNMKVHVNLLPDIHEKIAVIDDAVLWEGSLNILSHGNSKERMRRLVSPVEVHSAIEQHQLYACESCLFNYKRFGSGSQQLLIDRLARIRKAQKSTVTDVAKNCSISASWLARIEKNKSNISISTLIEIANELNVEPVLVPKILVPSILQILKNADIDEY